MCVPVVFFGQCLVNAVVEIFVVREDDVPANIVELDWCKRAVSGAVGLNWRGDLQSLRL